MRDLTDPTNRDSIPAMLTPGEWVINKEASQMFGPQLQAMNDAGLEQRAAENKMVKGDVPKYNAGGNIPYLTANDGKYVLSEDDKDLLIRMSLGESVGEDDEGRAGVMYTVLNRQKADQKQWGGNSIKDIINKNKKNKKGEIRYQFSSANPRSNNPTYHWYKDKIEESEEYLRSKAILEGMIKGDIVDPTNGAHYFLRPDDDNFYGFEGSDKLEGEGYPMEWWSKTHNRRKIGNHVFSSDDKVLGYQNPIVGYKSLIPKVRTLDVPTSNAEDHINNIMKSTRDSVENSFLNVPAMEDTPMYANTGASSIQTLIQGLLKGNKSGGFTKHKVNQLGRDQMTDEAMLYGSSQARNNVLGGPGDPYGRQLHSYPPRLDSHGFPYGIPSPEVEETPEKKDLWEFYTGKNDTPIQENIETNERRIMPGLNQTRQQQFSNWDGKNFVDSPYGGAVPNTGQNTLVTEGTTSSPEGPIPIDAQEEKSSNKWWNFLTKERKVAPWLGGGNLLKNNPIYSSDLFTDIVPENTPELLKDIQNPYISEDSVDFKPPISSEGIPGPGGSLISKETPIRSSLDYLRSEEKTLADLISQYNTDLSTSDREKLDKKVEDSKARLQIFESKNIRNAIIGIEKNKVVIDKALDKRQEYIDQGLAEDSPQVKSIDAYIEKVKGIADVSDAFKTSSMERINKAQPSLIHGSEADVRNKLIAYDNPQEPGSEPERAKIFGNDPFGGSTKAALQQMEIDKAEKPTKWKGILDAAEGVIKAAFDDVFDGKSLARAAMIYAAYRATGATGNQAIKAAGEDYMTQVAYVNKLDMWNNHVKKLASYNVFTKPSLELYNRSQDTDDLVRFSELNNTNYDASKTKVYYRLDKNGNKVGKYTAVYWSTGTGDKKQSGYMASIYNPKTKKNDKVKINPMDPLWTDDSVIARDFQSTDYLDFSASATTTYKGSVDDYLDTYTYDDTKQVSGKDSDKTFNTFSKVAPTAEAINLAHFGQRYNLPSAVVLEIYEQAMAEAYKHHIKTGGSGKASTIRGIAGMDVDSSFMNAAWIKIKIGQDESLFMTKPAEKSKRHATTYTHASSAQYDKPSDITNTFLKLQKMQKTRDGVTTYLFPNLHDKDLGVFSSGLLALVSEKIREINKNKPLDEVMFPDWNTWRENFVEGAGPNRDYQGSDKGNNAPIAKNIEDWRDSKGKAHAGKSEFLKYLEYLMYSERFN